MMIALRALTGIVIFAYLLFVVLSIIEFHQRINERQPWWFIVGYLVCIFWPIVILFDLVKNRIENSKMKTGGQ